MSRASSAEYLGIEILSNVTLAKGKKLKKENEVRIVNLLKNKSFIVKRIKSVRSEVRLPDENVNNVTMDDEMDTHNGSETVNESVQSEAPVASVNGTNANSTNGGANTVESTIMYPADFQG